MKKIERPILFSDAMVRAILEGRKTQTRRVLKPQPPAGAHSPGLVLFPADGGSACVFDVPLNSPVYRHECPYGQPGNRLWVREAFALHAHGAKDPAGHPIVFYRAQGDQIMQGNRWRPSIHMPRWASRIILDITDIRVERVQDISENDARAEGVREMAEYSMPRNPYEPGICDDPRNAYRILWDQINAKRGYGWDVNPWVWVVEFKRVTP